MKPDEIKASATALSVIQSFARTLRLEPHYLAYFGNENLLAAEHMIRTIRKLETFRFTFAGIVDAIVYRLPYLLQRWFYNKFEVTGYDAHVIAQKIIIHQQMNQAIQDDCEQVVFLGGGYDPRVCLASQQYKRVQFFDVSERVIRDHKLAAFGGICDKVLISSKDCVIFDHNLHVIECDLVLASLHQSLLSNGFNPKKKTLVIIDEMTASLPKTSLDEMITTLSGLLSIGSEIIMGFMPNQRHGIDKARTILTDRQVMEYVKQNGLFIKSKISMQTDPEPYFVLSKGSSKHLGKTYELPNIQVELDALLAPKSYHASYVKQSAFQAGVSLEHDSCRVTTTNRILKA